MLSSARLGLPSAAYALPAGAAVYEKCQFSSSLPTIPDFFAPKTTHGAPWSYFVNLETIVPPVPELYPNIHTYRQTDRHTNNFIHIIVKTV